MRIKCVGWDSTKNRYTIRKELHYIYSSIIYRMRKEECGGFDLYSNRENSSKRC